MAAKIVENMGKWKRRILVSGAVKRVCPLLSQKLEYGPDLAQFFVEFI